MQIGIRAKLLAGFAAVALFTSALGWYAAGAMEHLNDGQRTVYGDVFGGTHLLATWVDTSWEARADLLDYLLADDPAPHSGVREKMISLDAQLEQLAHQMDEADTDREDVETLAALVQAWDAYAAWRDEAILAPLDRGDRAAALDAYRTDGAHLATDIDDRIENFLSKKHIVGGQLESQAEASFDQTRLIAILLSIAAAGLGLGIGFFL